MLRTSRSALSLYRRSREISTASDRESFAAELIDRFPVRYRGLRGKPAGGSHGDQCAVQRRLGISNWTSWHQGAVFAFRTIRSWTLHALMELVRSAVRAH